ncbi:nitrate ABC transporter substrate-binding protein, partial [Thermodesulfobacteriota bacterium]
MKKAGLLILASIFVIFTITICSAAVHYVKAPPLTQSVKGSVSNVKGGITQVPLITWGGDEATILANGNARTTKKGSIFSKLGLKLKLVREDNFKNQIESYLKGETPYLRGTMGMVNMAAEVLSKDSRTKPKIIYQLTWSTGGDAL